MSKRNQLRTRDRSFWLVSVCDQSDLSFWAVVRPCIMVDACSRDIQSPWCQKAKEKETGVLGEGSKTSYSASPFKDSATS